MKIKIYTDGACSGNPGKGGYGVILRTKLKDGSLYEKELLKGFKKTTNNRMELLAVIDGLKALKYPCEVIVCSDSKYVVDAINKNWLNNWVSNEWKNTSGDVKNQDLWKELLILLDIHNVTFKWIKGHDENKYNNRCDELAVLARESNNLIEDKAYITNIN